VRTDNEWEDGHLPSAVHIFTPWLTRDLDGQFCKEKPVAIYCGSGYRASIAASVLKSMGYQNVSNVPGSMKAWEAAGLPLD